MNCIKCGKQIDDDSKFCIYCGYNQIDQAEYSSGDLEPFLKNGKWGYKDKDSRDVIVPPKYTYAGSFKDKRAVVGLNYKYSVIDQNGKELTSFKYDFITDFEEGFAKVKRDDRWTFINVDCKEITAFKFNKVESFINGLAKVGINDNYTLINQNGEQITEFYYENISDFSFINQKGNEITEFDNETIVDYDNSIAKVIRNKKFGLINTLGKEILFCDYDLIGIFTNGLAKISKNEKYGLVDLSGKIILPCEYADIDPFISGIAKVSKTNKYGIINSLGEIILPCDYDLVHILPNNSIAARENTTWKCFNKEGIDVTKTDEIFRKFKNRKNRNNSIIITFISIILVSITLCSYEYSTNKIEVIHKFQTLIYGKLKADWILARKVNSIKNFVGFINTYPDSKEADSALRRVRIILDPLVPYTKYLPKELVNSLEWKFSSDNQYAYFIQNAYVGYSFPIGRVNLSNNESKIFAAGGNFELIKKGRYKNYILILTGPGINWSQEPIEFSYSVYNPNSALIRKYNSKNDLLKEVKLLELSK